MKKISLIITSLVFFLGTFTLATGKVEATTKNNACGKAYSNGTLNKWEYVSKTSSKEKSSKKFISSSGKANRNGETYSVSHTEEVNVTVSGNSGISLRVIQSDIGFTIGKTKGKSVTKTSAPLKKGEIANAYSQKIYDVYKMKYTGYFLENGSCSAKTKYVTVKKQQSIPEITFTYTKK